MVSQLINERGNRAANQFVIDTPSGLYFQSYSSVVAKVDNNGNLILSHNWDYSNTTMKHLYIFMRYNGFGEYVYANNVRKAIENGDITLVNVSSLPLE